MNPLSPTATTGLLVLWLAFVLLDVGYNFIKIEVEKEKPWYLYLFVIRGMAAILHGIFFDTQSMLQYFPLFCFQIVSHFIIFNPVLNYLRYINGERSIRWWYTGKSSGWMDRFFGQHLLLYKAFYVLCMVLTVYMAVVTYHVYGR